LEISDLYEINAIGIAKVIASLGRIQGVTAGADAAFVSGVTLRADDPVHRTVRAFALQNAEEMLAVMAEIAVPATLMSCERLKFNIENDQKFTYGSLLASCTDIESRLRDEMTSVEMIGIDAAKVKYYRPLEPLFGDDVAVKFSSVAYEIEEAAKCYALDRSTASAFHSIRALEAGLRAVTRCLGIADPVKAADRSWSSVLRAIKSEIDRRWPPNLARIGGDDELFDNAYAALAAMQNPWRNATMHLDQKYTLEEARHVFEVVGGFMRKIASRMDEQGQPLA
jgi:hypothetical protein